MIKGNDSGNTYPEKFKDNGSYITDCKSIGNGFNIFLLMWDHHQQVKLQSSVTVNVYLKLRVPVI